MTPPPQDPFDPKTWNQTPPPNNPQNPYQQNPYQQNPPQNPYQQNPPQNPPPYQQNPYQQNPQNPYQQLPPWQLQGQQMPFNMQRDLPNSGGILALGIISIVGSFCYGIVGLGCAIPGLIMGNKAVRDYEMNPAAYSVSSYNNAKAGRICSIIGLCLSSLFILGLLVAIIADVNNF